MYKSIITRPLSIRETLYEVLSQGASEISEVRLFLDLLSFILVLQKTLEIKFPTLPHLKALKDITWVNVLRRQGHGSTFTQRNTCKKYPFYFSCRPIGLVLFFMGVFSRNPLHKGCQRLLKTLLQRMGLGAIDVHNKESNMKLQWLRSVNNSSRLVPKLLKGKIIDF